MNTMKHALINSNNASAHNKSVFNKNTLWPKVYGSATRKNGEIKSVVTRVPITHFWFNFFCFDYSLEKLNRRQDLHFILHRVFAWPLGLNIM